MENHDKLRIALLRVLQNASDPLSSESMAQNVCDLGFDVSPRTVRLYLEELEAEGLVAQAKRGPHGGRRITPRGIQELSIASVQERVGFLAVRMDTLAWQMSFDPLMKMGNIVLNLTVIAERDLERAKAEMRPVFEAGLGMGRLLALFQAGERVGRITIPDGKLGIGTVCSVTLNGVLVNSGIPTVSRFGGVLELLDRQPARFTDVIFYDGTSLDPLEIFIRSGLTSVRKAVMTRHGCIGASFREVPSCAIDEVERIVRRLEEVGLGGVVKIGKPGQPVLGFPVPDGRTGLVVNGGLNPAAAIYEAGIAAQNVALSHLYEFEHLRDYRDW